MSQQYDDTNRGALYKHDKKGNEKAPDYKGPLNVNGVEYELAGWMRISKAGKPYMSLSVEPKEQERPAPKARPMLGDVDSDIPFADPYKGRRSSVV